MKAAGDGPARRAQRKPIDGQVARFRSPKASVAKQDTGSLCSFTPPGDQDTAAAMSYIKKHLEEAEYSYRTRDSDLNEGLHILSKEVREIAQSIELLADQHKALKRSTYRMMFGQYFESMDKGLSPGGSIALLVRPLSRLRENLNVIARDADRAIETSDPNALSDQLFTLAPHVRRTIDLSHAVTQTILELHPVEAGLVPTQTPAPVRVKVEGDRLAISNLRTNTGTITNEAVDRVRRTAAEMVSAALLSIKDAGNVDRRVAPALEPLLRHLRASGADVSPEALGLNWKLATKLLNEYREELPAIAIFQLEEALSSVNVVINQYGEWRAYQAEHIASEIGPEDTQILVTEAQELAEEMVSAGEHVVDTEISMRLRDILAPAQSNLVSSETIIAPLVGSLSNIFAGVSEAALIIVSKAPAIPQGPAYALLMLSLSILDKGGRLASLPPFSFVKNAHTYITKHYPYLKDVIKL